MPRGDARMCAAAGHFRVLEEIAEPTRPRSVAECMSRWTTITLLIGIVAPTVWADEPSDALDEESRIARLAKAQVEMRLLLAKGAKLEAAGDLAGALKCYDAALAIHGALEGKLGPVSKTLRWQRARSAGATRKTRAAVKAALRWLSVHQDGNGRWDADGFNRHDPPDDKCDGPGGALYDIGVTGLALMAFLGDGYTARGSALDNPYAKNVRQGLRFLINSQDKEGCIGTRASQHYIYNHALATAALCDAFALTRNPRYRKPATEAVKFILQARNPYMAWRYGPRTGENDTSITSWCVEALAKARAAGLKIEGREYEQAMIGARAWMDKMTDPATGQTGYNFRGGTSARPEGLQDTFPSELTQAMTASSIVARLHAGQSREDAVIQKGIGLLLMDPPRFERKTGRIDQYYWYWGTRACHQIGGPEWKRWNKSIRPALLESQFREGSGARTGSWDPLGPWARDGGRVYATALMAMTLETYGERRIGRK